MEVLFWDKKSQKCLLVALESIWEDRMTVEPMRFYLKPFEQTYNHETEHTSLLGGHMVISVPGNTTLASRPIASIFMLYCYRFVLVRFRTNGMFFLSIRGYWASKELYGGVLRLGWVQTHMDACCYFSCITCLFYISNIYILQLSWNTFGNYCKFYFVKTYVN